VRVYASTACLDGGGSLWDILDAYAAEGLELVELGLSRLDDRDRLVERLRARPCSYAVHNYFPPAKEPFVLNLASGDDGIAARSVAFVQAALELASALEAPFYGVHGGFGVDPALAGGRLVTPPAPRREALVDAARRYEERIGPLADRARRLGVALLVENNVCTEADRGKLLHQTADELEELTEAVPGLGLLVDTGHLNVTARTLAFDREAFLRRLTTRIGAFHVHDNDSLVDRHLPLAPDAWAVPLLRLVGAPLVVEARFADASALAAHVAALEAL
jgi:sugar phosphate isomerase/epimerase